MNIEDLKIKLFADGADILTMQRQADLSYISGFTTNPSLMRKVGTKDYEAWAAVVLARVHGKPVSFEVIADDFTEMERQARKIAAWGENVYVKIPITNTRGDYSTDVIERLSHDGAQINVTAIMTPYQVMVAGLALMGGAPSIISVFAGRIADTGCDPVPMIRSFRDVGGDSTQVLWASVRELLNIQQAIEAGCDIITLPDNFLDKLPLLGKDLREFSLETVKQFYGDAVASGYTL